jgi:hypothetical protein
MRDIKQSISDILGTMIDRLCDPEVLGSIPGATRFSEK